MKRYRLRVAVLVVAVVSLLVFAAVPAWAAPPSPPTGVTAQSGSTTAAVLWTPGATNGNTITGYTLTPSPACSGTCTGLTTTGATSTSTSVGGLTNGTSYTFTVVANSSGGDSSPSAASNAVTPHANSNACAFDSFPNIPGGSSELAIRCTLTSAIGGSGSSYRVEDLPYANWHTGAGRSITTTLATSATSAVITASAAHFAAQDVNDVISGPGIPSNTFIKAVTTTTATLNKVVGSPGVAKGAKLTVNNSDGRTVIATAYGTNTITSATAHFCKVGLTGCNSGVTQKNDVGRTVSGTRIPHGSVITLVNSATQVTISQNVFACPSGVTAANCNQVGLSSVPNLSTSRQIKDATFISPNKVCSATAGFTQTDVNLPIASVAAPSKFPAGDYIASVGAGGTGCVGNTFAVLHAAYTAAGTNTKVFIGTRSSDAPINGDAVMSLGSELSVSPSLSAGLPNCSENSAVGTNLVGKWLNPGAFDTTALGQPSSTTITGPLIAQLDVTTGAGSPAFAGYVMLAKAGTAGDTDTAAHVDLVFPALLTGLAVCPSPSDVGVATTFRFFGETLSQSAAGSGDVRDFQDVPAGTAARIGSVYEHILTGPTPTEIFAASGSCMISFPTTRADYACSGT